MGSTKERNPSLWIATAPPERDHPALAAGPAEETGTVDVVVVGAGITGLSTALAIAERGASVVVLEAGRLAAGVTGYTTAKVTSLHGLTYAGLARSKGEETARAYGDANQAGLAQVRRWAESHTIECELVTRPAYTYAVDAASRPDVEAEVETAVGLGLPAAFTTDVELPFEVAGAVRFDGQAQFHPRRYCLGLARAVEAAGGRVHEHTRVVDLDGTTVKTEHGELRAGNVVLATHLPFADRGGFFAKAYPSRSYAIAFRVADDAGSVPKGMYLSADQPTRSLRTACDDGVLIVSGEGHKVGHDEDTTQRYDALESWARQHLPVAHVEHRWSAQDYVPVDGMPFVGRLLPGSSVWVATGFAKWGMSNGTAAGTMLADLIDGRDNPWASAFDSTRVMAAVTSRSFYEENVDVARAFVGDRLRTLTVPPADALGPGEGGIARLDGKKVAAFRDDDGTLHAVSPVCTHLGCTVAFNTAERTWDCPCHGSRYTVDGAVIQGPAVSDLEAHDTGGESAEQGTNPPG